MPSREINGTHLHCVDLGEGPELVLFSHGLLFHQGMWAQAMAHFTEGHAERIPAKRFRCVAYDHRGQGQSGREGARDMDTLADDAAALIERLQAEYRCGPVHFVGLSMGGFVGLRVAARRPELLRTLVLLDSSAEPESNPKKYRRLNTVVRLFGVIGAVQKRVLPVIFGRSTLEDPERAAVVQFWTDWLKNLPRDVTAAVQGVIMRAPVVDELAHIRCPTLIVVGEEDKATPPHKSERMAAGIEGAHLVRLPRCGHMSILEDPAATLTAMEAFWNAL